jgi:hypothetical protein
MEISLLLWVEAVLALQLISRQLVLKETQVRLMESLPLAVVAAAITRIREQRVVLVVVAAKTSTTLQK